MCCESLERNGGVRGRFLLPPVFLCAVLVAACSGDILFVTDRATECKELKEDFSESYSAVVLSDIHFNGDREMPAEYYRWLDELPEACSPRLCLVLGDIANDGLKKEYALYNEFVRKMAARGMSVYGILGNHDVFESGDYGRNYISSVKPHAACYVVRTPRLSYYFLDTADGAVGRPQYSALEEQMTADSNPKIILSHVPLYSPASGGILYRMKNREERAWLFSLLAEHDVRLFLCGHLHESFDYDMGAFREIIVDSVQEHLSWGILTVDERTGTFRYDTVQF